MMICNLKGENPKILHVLPAICAGKGLSSRLLGKFTFCSFRTKKLCSLFGGVHHAGCQNKNKKPFITGGFYVTEIISKNARGSYAIKLYGAKSLTIPPNQQALWMVPLII